MKITKNRLKQLIKEEIENVLNENPLAGPTAAGEPAKQQAAKPTADNPLAGATAAGEPQQIQKKAVALDKVEALLTKLVKQLQQL
jgi:hypothetical protein|tara:strand:- start:316 stop:570 length:255 start_codon:yes stop_codon:yes gene_type:complete